MTKDLKTKMKFSVTLKEKRLIVEQNQAYIFLDLFWVYNKAWASAADFYCELITSGGHSWAHHVKAAILWLKISSGLK